MFRPSVLITRLLSATTAAVVALVALSSQAQALRPDPGGVPASRSPLTEPSSSVWSEPALWVAVSVGVITLALVAAVVVKMRQHPLLRHSQPSPSA
jgi:hypothetical protein